MLATLLVGSVGLRVPVVTMSQRTEPSPFAPPLPLMKPMAAGLVWTAQQAPAVLPLTHAAMDWLANEQAIAMRAQGRVPAAAAAAPVRAAPSYSYTPEAEVAVPEPAAKPRPTREQLVQVMQSTFAYAADALAKLIATRLELLFLNIRLALRRRADATLNEARATIERVRTLPARLADEAQTTLATTAREAEERINMLVAEAEQQRDSLTERVGGATAVPKSR